MSAEPDNPMDPDESLQGPKKKNSRNPRTDDEVMKQEHKIIDMIMPETRNHPDLYDRVVRLLKSTNVGKLRTISDWKLQRDFKDMVKYTDDNTYPALDCTIALLAGCDHFLIDRPHSPLRLRMESRGLRKWAIEQMGLLEDKGNKTQEKGATKGRDEVVKKKKEKVPMIKEEADESAQVQLPREPFIGNQIRPSIETPIPAVQQIAVQSQPRPQQTAYPGGASPASTLAQIKSSPDQAFAALHNTAEHSLKRKRSTSYEKVVPLKVYLRDAGTQTEPEEPPTSAKEMKAVIDKFNDMSDKIEQMHQTLTSRAEAEQVAQERRIENSVVRRLTRNAQAGGEGGFAPGPMYPGFARAPSMYPVQEVEVVPRRRGRMAFPQGTVVDYDYDIGR